MYSLQQCTVSTASQKRGVQTVCPKRKGGRNYSKLLKMLCVERHAIKIDLSLSFLVLYTYMHWVLVTLDMEARGVEAHFFCLFSDYSASYICALQDNITFTIIIIYSSHSSTIFKSHIHDIYKQGQGFHS